MLFQETDCEETCRRVTCEGREALTINGDPAFFLNATGGSQLLLILSLPVVRSYVWRLDSASHLEVSIQILHKYSSMPSVL